MFDFVNTKETICSLHGDNFSETQIQWAISEPPETMIV